MKHSPSAATSPLHISSQVHAMSSSSQASMSNYSSMSNGIPPVTIIDETTSDVPLSNLMPSTFVPKVEETCTDSGLYTMNSILNARASAVLNNRASLINEASSSAVREGPSLINGSMASSSQNKFMPSAFAAASKSTPSDVNWILSQDLYANEPNIDNWLGQIFKSDNLVAGCSLPQAHEK